MGKAKSLLLATTVAVAVALAGGSAFAADLYVPPPAPPTAAPAPASNGLYVSVFGGYAFATSIYGHTAGTPGSDITVPLQGGYVIGAAIGTHLTDNLRGEVELSYSSRNVDAANVATFSGSADFTGSGSALYLLGNLWYDIDTGTSFTPYIGGGLGIAEVMPDVTSLAGTTYSNATAFAAQLGAGVKFQVSDNIALDLGYRAKGVFNTTLTGSGVGNDLTNAHYVDQSVQAGLTFSF